MNKFLGGVLGTATAIALALPAAAQTIDYGSLEQLFGEPVTTSATGKPQRASDAPVSMEIISADDIRRTGATNIPDILQRVVGLDVARFAVSQSEVSVRGYNSSFNPRLLVLVDGRQVYLDHYGMTNWDALPVQMAEIRQIEVVKGPNTALFGFNAVGGVVNIITYSPLYDDVDNVTVRTGTQGYREGSAVTTFKLGEKVGVRLSTGGYNAENFDTNVTDPGERDTLSLSPRRRSLAANVLAQVTPDSQLGAEFTGVHERRTEMVNSYFYANGDYELWSGKLTYTANTGIGLVEATAYQNVADVDAFTSNLNVAFNNTVRVAKIQDLFKVGTDHSFRVSAEWRNNQLKDISGTDAKVSYDVYSVGGMWDWAISEKWNLVNALRLDHLRLDRSGPFQGGASAPFTNDDYDRSLTQPSFNSGLVYKATDIDTVRLSVARGVGVPSLFEFGNMQASFFGPFFFGSYGSPRLDPTIVTNYELAYDRAIKEIGGGLRTSVYYQTNEDVRSASRPLVSSPLAIVSETDNVGDSKAVGAEASLRGKIGSDWSWKVGYAFEVVKDDYEAFAATAVNHEDSTPRHKLSAELGYTHGKWEANLFGQYISSTDMLRSSSDFLTVGSSNIPSSLTLAARVGYEITEGVQLAATGFNITQDSQRLTSGYPEERRILFSLSSNF
ncbi:TonB-dependent receptor plug domain-containing protein [Arenibaculum pallidiluteum]|uniref:TonB-dependent receptor plug domain-containing protein n=1 Tax=Arenibaculum pallidiluteum TaxID=2812559 RepID=UPI001A96B047|nr:TonB-dependent receptor [Arenibaculum pallidiluteum]